MKENKQLFIYSLIVTAISLIVIAFTINYENNFWCNIFQNILAGSVVLIGTSWISYSRNKRILLENILTCCSKFSSKFGKIHHLKELPTYDEYKRQRLLSDEKISEEVLVDDYKEYKLKFINEHKKEAEKIMHYYIELSNTEMKEFWDLYGELDFLTGKKKRYKLYNNIFKYTNELINAIIEKSYHFKIYFETENGDGNIGVNVQFINELQRKFFTRTTYHEIENIQKEKTLANLYCYSEEECYYNSQQLYYSEKFEEIKKITY